MIVFCDYLTPQRTAATSWHQRPHTNTMKVHAHWHTSVQGSNTSIRRPENLIFMLNWTNSPVKGFCHLVWIDNTTHSQIQTLGHRHTPTVLWAHLINKTKNKKKIHNRLETHRRGCIVTLHPSSLATLLTDKNKKLVFFSICAWVSVDMFTYSTCTTLRCHKFNNKVHVEMNYYSSAVWQCIFRKSVEEIERKISLTSGLTRHAGLCGQITDAEQWSTGEAVSAEDSNKVTAEQKTSFLFTHCQSSVFPALSISVMLSCWYHVCSICCGNTLPPLLSPSLFYVSTRPASSNWVPPIWAPGFFLLKGSLSSVHALEGFRQSKDNFLLMNKKKKKIKLYFNMNCCTIVTLKL